MASGTGSSPCLERSLSQGAGSIGIPLLGSVWYNVYMWLWPVGLQDKVPIDGLKEWEWFEWTVGRAMHVGVGQ